MINFDDVAKANKKSNNYYLLQVTDNTYRILKLEAQDLKNKFII